MLDDTYVRVFQMPNTDGLWIGFYRAERDNVYLFTTSGEWKKQDQYGQMDPKDGSYWFLPGRWEFGRKLIDALIEHGIQPTQYIPMKNELDAVHQHLDDMRALVGKLTDTKLPERE